ncbi:chorismate-binding protein [Candidatus Pandoraea novymonadis]|uniref:Aminodeoxychorismate synthase component 1 n=1 Tax=Candidatus Pandoraea novymonadis TaxID=1808959 RepID=A0ABX5FDR7_9BURK|nr:chorismate-binding protein [Candidatus Pandoraea novymonadis]PSB91879.1 Aminodeoxychorismate synthase component 1 [Candidatus Pandoraea novymonadis]
MMQEVRMTGFALLDDNAESAGGARLYTGLVREVICDDSVSFESTLNEIEMAVREGLYAVLLVDYEFGVRLSDIEIEAPTGAFRGLLFAHMEKLDGSAVQEWLTMQDMGVDIYTASSISNVASCSMFSRNSSLLATQHDEAMRGIAGIAGLRASITQDHFSEVISRIHDLLTRGECYQINYTYRLYFDVFGSPVTLYRRLREKQPVPFGALIVWPDKEGKPGRAVLSLSPELFIRHQEGKCFAKPMKGTAPASGNEIVDAEASCLLSGDEKNRAENLMIVDLLRNDLAQLAVIGSVGVSRLFEVTRFASVLQMTSTVTAVLSSDVGLADIFYALFPCGSITGAPKRCTMKLIGELETEPRGLYTGAIGWLDKPRDNGRMLGDFCLSVAIRTIILDSSREDGMRDGCLGVGAGIVHDSRSEEEWEECQWKTRFLTSIDPGFQLIETMAVTRQQGIRHLPLHLKRLANSAEYFGFKCCLATIENKLDQLCKQLDDGPYRVRLILSHDGSLSLSHRVLSPVVDATVLLNNVEQVTTSASDLFLRHKTTVRRVYDAALQLAEAKGAFDVLFFNERGELTEGARSNVFLKRDGCWFTPPLSSGVLPGVMRAVLLSDTTFGAKEVPLMRNDVILAEHIIVCNALRGVLPVRLISG